MMTFQKAAVSLVALLVTVTAGTGAHAQGDLYRHIDQLALKIERKARSLKHVISRYRHTPQYQHLVEDAVEMCRLADHIHELAHRGGSWRHLESDLRDLDRAYHHVEQLVDRIEHDAALGAGHVHGNTRVVWSILEDIGEYIHHLRDDLRRLRLASIRHRGVHDPYHSGWGTGSRYYNDLHRASCNYGNGIRFDTAGRGGITLGTGHLQFRIGF